MYLTHLSKDQYIINELLSNSRELFAEYQPARLENDIDFINKMVEKLPPQVYEPIDVNQVKDDEHDNIEEMEKMEKDFDEQQDDRDYSIDEDITTMTMISKMIKAIKSIEIIGQVTKNIGVN